MLNPLFSISVCLIASFFLSFFALLTADEKSFRLSSMQIECALLIVSCDHMDGLLYALLYITCFQYIVLHMWVPFDLIQFNVFMCIIYTHHGYLLHSHVN